MPTNINKIIEQFVDEVYSILGNRVKKIILYGSYARGDYNKNSDIDLMILTDLNEKEIEEYRDKLSDAAFEIELKNNVIISPVIKNIEKYNAKVNIIPFYTNVQKEGVVLNG